LACVAALLLRSTVTRRTRARHRLKTAMAHSGNQSRSQAQRFLIDRKAGTVKNGCVDAAYEGQIRVRRKGPAIAAGPASSNRDRLSGCRFARRRGLCWRRAALATAVNLRLPSSRPAASAALVHIRLIMLSRWRSAGSFRDVGRNQCKCTTTALRHAWQNAVSRS
jgi:hypothetical protein